MPSKYRIILEMASQTARDIASNADRYTDFLITAANNYKYSFKEQLLIHAQKPDATACAEIDTWNKLGRWVNKGTKGIALLIDRDVPYKLRHIFDISDTNSRAGRNITLWQMKPEYEYAVSESLQASFGDVEEPRDFPHLLMDISGYAVEDNLSDYLMEMNAVKAGSFLEELDDTSLEAWLKTTLKSSVAFMALSRAGYEPRQYFDREDFSHLFDFNTVEVTSKGTLDTENTFDSYLYQLVESKQKFIGQIMTSKSPVRSAEDIDETALSYAEIKALCAGDPHIKEKMDLDIDVSRLKLLKANHLSQRYSLEDQILKEFPQKIRSLEQHIEGYQTDIDQRKRNTEPNEDGFSPMFMPGGTVREKKAAGDAILGLCKAMTSPDPIPIGQYRGFDMELSFDTFSREYKITLIHQLRHTVTLGTDIFGNIQRLDNTLGAFEERMAACVEQLENTRVQLENAKAEVQKPFSQEEELKAKSERLNELNAMLNLDKRENEIVDGERADEEPSRSSDDRER